MGKKAGKKLGRRKGRGLSCEEGEGNGNKREKKNSRPVMRVSHEPRNMILNPMLLIWGLKQKKMCSNNQRNSRFYMKGISEISN